MERSSLRAGMMTETEVSTAVALDDPGPGRAVYLVVQISHRVDETLPAKMAFGVPSGGVTQPHRAVTILEQADDSGRESLRPRLDEDGPVFGQEGAVCRDVRRHDGSTGREIVEDLQGKVATVHPR